MNVEHSAKGAKLAGRSSAPLIAASALLSCLGAVSAFALVPAGQSAAVTAPPLDWSALRISLAPAEAFQATTVRSRLERLPARPVKSAQLQAFLAEHRGRLVQSGHRRFTGIAGADLVATLRGQGVPTASIADFVRAIGSRLNLSNGVSTADRFDLVMTYERTADGADRFGPLLYAGLDRVGASDVQLVRWTVGRNSDWVDASGVGGTTEGSMMPVRGGVSSGFGMRNHPLLHRARFHRGLDLRAAYGTPISAAADGIVTMAGWAGGYGRQVRIAHGKFQTSYAHMSRFAVSPGTRVHRGQVIGFVGSSGLSTGPHLHYEVIRSGRAVDPPSLSATITNHVPDGEDRFVRQHLRGLLAG